MRAAGRWSGPVWRLRVCELAVRLRAEGWFAYAGMPSRTRAAGEAGGAIAVALGGGDVAADDRGLIGWMSFHP